MQVADKTVVIAGLGVSGTSLARMIEGTAATPRDWRRREEARGRSPLL